MLANNFPKDQGTVSMLKEPVYAVATPTYNNRKTAVLYYFKKWLYEAGYGTQQQYCGRVAQKEKLVFLAKTMDQTIYKYDTTTGSQYAIYKHTGLPSPSTLYWDSDTGNLWLMGESFGPNNNREFELTVIDKDGNIVRPKQNMPGNVLKTGTNSAAEGRYCVVGRTMYLQRDKSTKDLQLIDLDTFALSTVPTGLRYAPTYIKAGFQSENIVFFSNKSEAGYLDITTGKVQSFDFSYSYEAKKYPAMVSAGWDQYDKAYSMRIYSYLKPDKSIGHRIMIQGEKANSTLDTRYRWYIFEIDIDKISTDKYNCIVDGSHRPIKMNKEDFGSLENVTEGNIDIIINDETMPGLMFFHYTSGQAGSRGNVICVSNDGGLTQSHFMGVGESSGDTNWLNTHGIWNDAGVVDGSIWIAGYEGMASLSPYVRPGSSILAYDGKNVQVPSEDITNFFFSD